MHNWKKTSLVTSFVLLTLLIGIYYVFNINLSIPSSKIEFSPGKDSRSTQAEYHGIKPKNIIVFIADGMGFGHLSLALNTQQSESMPSIWQEFDVKGWHDAKSIYGPLTDSEASATAMATGESTSFGHIGIDKDGNTLTNIFEIASDQQYATGIVTDSYVWDGTPAAFVTHIRNEDDARNILKQIADSELDIIFGELEDLGEGDVPEKNESLEILSERFQLLNSSLELPDMDSGLRPIAAIFDEDEIQDLESTPNLTKLTDVALTYLSLKDKPFLLLVESEEMDAASHNNDSERVLKGLKSIQQTLSLVMEYSKKQGETLVLFTADHETGGLAAVADFTNYPNLQIRWSTKDHSAAVVPLFAYGPGAHYFADVHRNWEIGKRLKSLISSGFIESESGLKYKTLKEGTGESAEIGDEVLIFETTSYRDGTVLYSNENSTNPIKVELGANMVTLGVEEGLHGMRSGEIRELIVPHYLALRTVYPDNVSPDSTLVIKIIVSKVVKTN